MRENKEIYIVNGKEIEFPIKVNNMFVHLYDVKGLYKAFCIGSDANEVFTDHEECDYVGMKKEDYQELLKSFGAKQYHHEFDYGDGFVLPVQDSYFEELDSAIKCINHINKL